MKKSLAWFVCFALCMTVLVSPVLAEEAGQGVDAYTFLHRYASWYALLYPNTNSIPSLTASRDGTGTISIGSLAVTIDPATQLVSTVQCTLKREDDAFINQMVAIVAALTNDTAAAGTFTQEQVTAWIKVCTEAVQRDKENPYVLGNYELYILSTDTEVNLYAIFETGAGLAAGEAAPGADEEASIQQYIQQNEGQYKALDVGDEGEQVMALKERLYALGYFTSKNYSDKYNEVTQKRVKMFQLANGLNDTGIATPETQALLFSGNAVKNPYPLAD